MKRKLFKNLNIYESVIDKRVVDVLLNFYNRRIKNLTL